TETDRHPQAGTFAEFLQQSSFPKEQKQRLEELYQQLPRRRHVRTRQSQVESNSQESQKIQKPSRFYHHFMIYVCLVLIGVLLLIFFHSPRQNRAKNWCTTTAVSTHSIGESFFLYFNETVPLNNFDDVKFYIYFDTNEYISSQTLSSQKLDTTNHRWIYTISSNWVQTHPQWHDPFLWHVDYEC
ncbi:MAG: hypothetical protein K8F30_15540, partial [Taibaiella sp.]|nr:hypothetical protein [Taibaiella sp.]